MTDSETGKVSYRLDLVLTLDQQVQQLLSVHGGLPVVGHQANEGCVPLVGDLGEGGATTAHQHLPDAVLKRLESLIIHSQESLQTKRRSSLYEQLTFASCVRLENDALQVNLTKHAAKVLLLQVNNILQSTSIGCC